MGDITELIGRFKGHSKQAFSLLVGYYFRPLAAYAERGLYGPYASLTGGEDIALSACHGLWRVVEGREPLAESLTDRHRLWRVLRLLVRQRLRRVRRDGTRQRRDCRRTMSAFQGLESPAGTSVLDGVAARGAPPDEEALWNITEEELLGTLSAEQRAIVQLKRFGSTNREVADHLEWSMRAVERELSTIRTICREHLNS